MFSQVEFTAAHEELAFRIGANEAAFLVNQFGAADGTELPPVFRFVLLAFGGLGLAHNTIVLHVWQDLDSQRAPKSFRAFSPRTFFFAWTLVLVSLMMATAFLR